MSAKSPVGFSRRIKLEWLERTAALTQAGTGIDDTREILLELVGETRSVGKAKTRGSGEISVTILLKTWVLVPKDLEAFRNDGLKHLAGLPHNQHLPLHWGMAMSAYPFFARVAEATGRLLRLQDNITLSQVQRRLREQLGERDTVSRAAQRVLRTFVDWGVLSDTATRGTYASAVPVEVGDREVGAWLVESVIHASGSEACGLQEAMSNPALFPFHMPSLNAADVELSGRMEVYSQALNREMIVLSRNSAEENF